MAHYWVAKRYAKGLMDFLESSPEKEDIVMKEIKQLGELLREKEDLRNFFNSPVLEHRKMTAIMNEVFKDFTEETRNFLSLIIKQGRSRAIESIASEVMKLYRKKHKIEKATITSAYPLDDNQINAIIEKAKAGLPMGTTVEVTNRVNPDLIGGFVLRLADTQVDASLKTKLENIKKEFETKQHFIPKI
ncbi:ATP synthase F1 subunit delta [Flavobacteriaceae bacterium Ap0902]|nr:ATP synthase F1 subunit delta [Flavobacteriaceae bacterium Ap0902]